MTALRISQIMKFYLLLVAASLLAMISVSSANDPEYNPDEQFFMIDPIDYQIGDPLSYVDIAVDTPFTPEELKNMNGGGQRKRMALDQKVVKKRDAKALNYADFYPDYNPEDYNPGGPHPDDYNPDYYNHEGPHPDDYNPEYYNPGGGHHPDYYNPEDYNPGGPHPDEYNPDYYNPGRPHPDDYNPEYYNPDGHHSEDYHYYQGFRKRIIKNAGAYNGVDRKAPNEKVVKKRDADEDYYAESPGDYEDYQARGMPSADSELLRKKREARDYEDDYDYPTTDRDNKRMMPQGNALEREAPHEKARANMKTMKRDDELYLAVEPDYYDDYRKRMIKNAGANNGVDRKAPNEKARANMETMKREYEEYVTDEPEYSEDYRKRMIEPGNILERMILDQRARAKDTKKDNNKKNEDEYNYEEYPEGDYNYGEEGDNYNDEDYNGGYYDYDRRK